MDSAESQGGKAPIHGYGIPGRTRSVKPSVEETERGYYLLEGSCREKVGTSVSSGETSAAQEGGEKTHKTHGRETGKTQRGIPRL